MQVIQDLTAFEERLGRVTSLKKLTGSAYGGMCVCVCVVCVCVCIHTCMHAYIRMYIRTYIQTLRVYIHLTGSAYGGMCVCVCECVYVCKVMKKK
jgi:hypothetical protein